MPSLTSALAVGGAAGAIVLGVLGRLAMALLAIVGGSPHNLTLDGFVEVAALGFLVGAGGGILIHAIAARRGALRTADGIVVGGILFAVSVAAAWAAGGLSPRAPAALAATLAVAALLYVVYGIATTRLLRRRRA